MALISASASDVGRTRKANEDSVAADAERGLFVVADGLGGHVAGRTASETAVASFITSALARHIDPLADPLVLLRGAIRTANAAILDRVANQPELKGMATTLAALWIHGERAAIAHVGDSRIYLLRGSALYLLTLDHSYVCELLFRRRIDADLARRHPNRHVILRALGVLPPAEPDACALALEAGDVFLLCTDGIHAQLTDAEIHETLRAAGADVASAARSLIDRANDHGGHDNASAVLVHVTSRTARS